MPLTVLSGSTLGYELVSILNGNFSYLESLASGSLKYVGTLSGVTGEQTITHNLNSTEVVVAIWDSTGVQVYADVTILTVNTLRINFVEPFTGKVVVMA